MNFVMMLALLATTQAPADIKALDFKLVGVKTVTAAPLEQGPIDIHVRIKKDSTPLISTTSYQFPLSYVTTTQPQVVREAKSDRDGPAQYFQEPGGQPYRIVRRYVVSSPSQVYTASDPSTTCANGVCPVPSSIARVQSFAPSQVYTYSQGFETTAPMVSVQSYSSMGSCAGGSCAIPSSMMGVQSFGAPMGGGLRSFGARIFGGASGGCAGGSCR